MLTAFSIYAFVYPFAILLLSFDWMPFGMEWMSSLLLTMLGVTVGAWLWVNFSGRGLLVACGILFAGLALEYVGVQTGMPFGQYRYTGVLVPELVGGVPAAIGFAWLLVVVGGVFTAIRALGGRANVWAVCALGALLAVGLDLLLEPVAYRVKGYWQWYEAGGYYGVPWSNFLAWAIATFLMNLLAFSGLNLAGHTRWSWTPVTLYFMNVAMFSIVGVTHGFWWSALIGLLLLISAGLRLLRKHALSTRPAPSGTTTSS